MIQGMALADTLMLMARLQRQNKPMFTRLLRDANTFLKASNDDDHSDAREVLDNIAHYYAIDLEPTA
jgi:hypothetical protein